MAQIIKLRRSAVAGNVPTTSQLGLGELAINTADGKIYFEKNDGSATIQTIVTTNSETTGSITITGNISGSSTSTGSFGTLQVGNQHIFGDSDGIGIGISNPAHKLDVSGNANGNFAARIINAHSNGMGLMVRGGASSTNRGISLENSTQATVWKANLDGTTVQTNTLEVTSGNISGSATSTGSFGNVYVDETLEIGNGTQAVNISILGPNSNASSSKLSFGDNATHGVYPGYNGVSFRFDTDANKLIFEDEYNGGLSGTRTLFEVLRDGNFAISGSATSTGSFGAGFIDNKLGIGTTSPNTALHVSGSWVGYYGVVGIEGPENGLNGIALRSSDGTGNGEYKGFWIFRDGSGGDKMEFGTQLSYAPLHLQTGGHNNRVTIAGDGSYVEFPDANVKISGSATSTGSFGVIRSTSTLGFSLFNNQVYVNKDGSASTPSINVMPQGGNGFYKYASNEIGVATNGTATARFSSTAGLEMLVGNVSGSAASTGSFGRTITKTMSVDDIFFDGADAPNSVNPRARFFYQKASYNTIYGDIYHAGGAGGLTFEDNYNNAAGGFNFILQNGTSAFRIKGNGDGDITFNGDISGSATSTGSFGRIETAGNSIITGNLDVGSSLDVTGNIEASNYLKAGGNLIVGATDAMGIRFDQSSGTDSTHFSIHQNGASGKDIAINANGSGNRVILSNANTASLATDQDNNVLFPAHNAKISGSHSSTGSFGSGRISDKLGIGTVAPVSRLEIEDGGTSKAMLLKLTSDDNQVYGIVVGNDTFSTSDTDGGQHILGNDGTYIIRSLGTSTAARIGAGTAWNNYKYLEIDFDSDTAEFTTTKISGSATSTGSFGALRVGSTVGSLSSGLSFGDGDTGFYENADDDFKLDRGGNNVFRANTSSGLDFGVSNLFYNQTGGFWINSPAGSAAAPNYVFRGDTDTGMFRIDADRLGFSTGGVLQLEISSNKISGSATSTGSFGRVEAQVVHADGFQSTTGGVSVLFNDSVEVIGNVSGSAASTGSFGSLYVDNRIGLGITNPEDYYPGSVTPVVIGSGAANANNAGISVISSNSGYGALYFGDGTGASVYRGAVEYNHSDDSLKIWTSGTTGTGRAITIDSSNNIAFGGNVSGSATSTGSFGAGFIDDKLGIDTTAPQEKLDISGGNIRLDDGQSLNFASTDGNIGRVRIIGSEDSDYLRFNTDNAIRMAIVNQGVVIGTNVTSTAVGQGGLEVRGNISGSGTGSFGAGLFHHGVKVGTDHTANAARGVFDVRVSDNNQGFYVGSGGGAVYLPTDIGHSSNAGTFDLQPRNYRLGTNGGGAVSIYPKHDAQLNLGTTDDNDLLVLSGSTKISGSAISTGSFGSLVVSDAVQGNLTIEGDLIARQYIISSSVTHLTQSAISGSSLFGDSPDDKHEFTGSLNVTGSIVVRPDNSDLTDNNALGLYIKGLNGGIKIGRHSGNDGAFTHLYTDIASADFLYVKNNGADSGGIATDRIGASTVNPLNNMLYFNGAQLEFVNGHLGGTSNPYQIHNNSGLAINLTSDKYYRVSGSTMRFTPADYFEVVGNIQASGNISGSATSTGSFGSLVVADKVQGNLTLGGQFYLGSSNQLRIYSEGSGGSDNQIILGKLNDLKLFNQHHGGNISFHVENSSGTAIQAMTIDGDGNAAFFKNVSGSSTSTGSFGDGRIANKLGIGTSSPESILHIADGSSGAIGAKLIIDNDVSDADGNGTEISFFNAAGASAAGVANSRIRSVASGNTNGYSQLQFWTYHASEAQRMVITSTGNVGIGSSSPASLLHIGDATTDTSVDSTTYLKIAKSGTVRMQLNSTNSGVAGLHFGDTADVDIGSIEYTNSSNQFDIYTNASHAITIDSSQKLIASGDISGSATSTGSFGRVFVDGGNIATLGNMILDADGAQIRLQDGGTEFGRISRVSSDLVIKSISNNNDILLKGVDGGSTITALQLDMSEGGNAIFSANISGSATSTGSFGTVETSNIKVGGGIFTSASLAAGGGGGGSGAIGSVSNGADNRIATFSSNNDLNGEANLTFDDTTLIATGNISSSGQFIAKASTDAGSPGYTFAGDLDTGLYHAGANTLGLTTGGTIRMSLTSGALSSQTTGGGRIGIPNGSAAGPTFTFNDDADTGMFRVGADTIGLSTGGSERVRIDSNGNFGIGTTASKLYTGISGTSARYLSIVGSQASTIELGRDASVDGYAVGRLQFLNLNNADSSNNDADGKLIAYISSHVVTSDSNAGDDSGGDLRFITKPEAGAWVERMRITSDGNVGIGQTTPDSGSLLHVTYSDNTTSTTATGTGQHNYGIKLENTSTTTGAFSQLHLRAGTADGYIRYIYNNTNDGRLGFFVDNTNDVKEVFTISNDGKQISGSATSTGSFGKLLGDGSDLTGITSFAGSAGTETSFSGSAASTGSFGAIGILTPPTKPFHINSSGVHRPMLIKSTGDQNTFIVMDSNRSGAASYTGGIVGQWNGTEVSSIYFRTGADTTNKDDGYISFQTAGAGSASERMIITTGGKVGIGGQSHANVDGLLHVHSGTAGSVDANANADDLVVENSDHGGMTILTPDDKIAYLMFGDASDSARAGFQYYHEGVDSNERLIFNVSGGEKARLTDAGDFVLSLGGVSGSATSTGSFGTLRVGPTSGYGAASGIAFGDGDTAIYEQSNDVLNVKIGAQVKWQFNGDNILSPGSNKAQISPDNGVTSPTFIPGRNHTDTGYGSNGGKMLSLIAGGASILQVSSSGTISGSSTSTGSFGVTQTEGIRGLAGVYNNGEVLIPDTLKFGADTDSMLRRRTANDVEFRLGNTDIFRVHTSGVYVETGNLEVQSGNIEASGNISGSSTSTGSFGHGIIDGNLDVGGTVTAQEFHTEFVSSSIVFQSGSTKFGDTSDDTHQFTGSLNVNGNIQSTSGDNLSIGTSWSPAGTYGVGRFHGAHDGGGTRVMFSNANSSVRYGIVMHGSDTGTADKLGIGLLLNENATYANASPAMTIDSSKNIGMGTQSPSNKLHVFSSGNGGLEIDATGGAPTLFFDIPGNEQGRIYFQEDDTLLGGIVYETTSTDYLSFRVGGSSANVERLRITGDNKISGSATSTGSFGALSIPGQATIGSVVEASSIMYKENITPIDSPLEKITKLRGVEFDYKNTNEHSIGMIAEEVNDIFPELVAKDDKGDITAMSYTRMTAVLLEAVKELTEEVRELKAKNNYTKEKGKN